MARAIADGDVLRRETVSGREFVVVARSVSVTSGPSGIMADGAIILRTSHQLRWFYIKVVKDGRFIRRRYPHTARVLVEEWVPAEQWKPKRRDDIDAARTVLAALDTARKEGRIRG